MILVRYLVVAEKCYWWLYSYSVVVEYLRVQEGESDDPERLTSDCGAVDGILGYLSIGVHSYCMSYG